MLLSLLALAAAVAAPAPPSLEAREQVRACVAVEVEPAVAVAACRRALELGLGPEWSASIRLLLARRLISAARWEEVVVAYRDHVAASPGDADAQRRLGLALLLGLGRAGEAAEALRAATRAAPEDAEAWAALGTALNALGRHPDAEAAFAEAGRVAPDYFETHPAAAAVRAASARGEPFPPPAEPTEPED